MNASDPITAALFSAFIKCPTKAFLLAIGEHPPEAYFADIEARIASLYKAAMKRQLRVGPEAAEPINFGELWSNSDNSVARYEVECETAVYDSASPHRRPRAHESPFVPVLFSPWDKPTLSDKLLVCFGALSLLQATGILADAGILIYGEGYRRRTVKIADHLTRARQYINAIAATCRSREPPPLVLNKHCAVCDFQPRCHGLAIKRDNLSLLDGMTAKERAKCNAKGIFTITQLSYGYRPRRRKRTKTDGEGPTEFAKRAAASDRNDHKIRALAIKKNQIHVVGAPSIRLAGVPIFLDVEGTPDRDFYYLVGIRFKRGDEQVERSFWADELEGERAMWESFLSTLKGVKNPQIVSYGAYEIRFRKKMKERYVITEADKEIVNKLIANSINLVGCIYTKIYFPTFSNSLKKIGRYLGFKWTWPRASGSAALLLRRAWELDTDDNFKRELIGYNMDACRAAATVAEALVRVCGGGASGLDAVEVGSLEVGFEQTWGKFDSALPEFAKINDAAYWDYQRDRVYIRSNPSLRRAAKRKRKNEHRSLRVNTTVGPAPPCECPTCNSKSISMSGRHRRIFFDMRFFDGGLRRWITKHIVDHYKCRDCGFSFASETRRLKRYKYSDNVLAYVIYNLIELHISQNKLANIMLKIFGYSPSQSAISSMIQRAVNTYRDAYDDIVQRISCGNLIHSDETHVSVKGKDSYVWVFTSMEEVIYIWSESREGSIATELLKDFKGVLVSDFYPVYDSVDCPQQKCLVHLMRDLNDAIHQEPFNLEMKEVAQEFATLLKQIIDTIDRFGLKSRFMKKHKQAVTRFYDSLSLRKYTTELAQKVQKRFNKNWGKLFTFLDYNDVPWNNNYAEHAIKSFADLRDAIGGATTQRGIRNYLTPAMDKP